MELMRLAEVGGEALGYSASHGSFGGETSVSAHVTSTTYFLARCTYARRVQGCGGAENEASLSGNGGSFRRQAPQLRAYTRTITHAYHEMASPLLTLI